MGDLPLLQRQMQMCKQQLHYNYLSLQPKETLHVKCTTLLFAVKGMITQRMEKNDQSLLSFLSEHLCQTFFRYYNEKKTLDKKIYIFLFQYSLLVATLTCCTNMPGDPETVTPCVPHHNFCATTKVIFASKFWTFNFMQHLKMCQKK